MMTGSEFTELPVRFSHAERVATLPRHHGDPFDRMLIAQATVEGATLVTHDRRFEPYGIPVVWV
jgi:PIN domain nuclease of toxin-antitoxin system